VFNSVYAGLEAIADGLNPLTIFLRSSLPFFACGGR